MRARTHGEPSDELVAIQSPFEQCLTCPVTGVVHQPHEHVGRIRPGDADFVSAQERLTDRTGKRFGRQWVPVLRRRLPTPLRRLPRQPLRLAQQRRDRGVAGGRRVVDAVLADPVVDALRCDDPHQRAADARFGGEQILCRRFACEQREEQVLRSRGGLVEPDGPPECLDQQLHHLAGGVGRGRVWFWPYLGPLG